METYKTSKTSSICIVKDFDLRPGLLYIDDFDTKMVALKPVPGKYDIPLWFPVDVCFMYDDDLFQRIKMAFQNGDQRLLKELWSQAKPWKEE